MLDKAYGLSIKHTSLSNGADGHDSQDALWQQRCSRVGVRAATGDPNHKELAHA